MGIVLFPFKELNQNSLPFNIDTRSLAVNMRNKQKYTIYTLSFCEFLDFIIKVKTIRTTNKGIVFSINAILIKAFQMHYIHISTEYSCLPLLSIKVPISILYSYCECIISFLSCFIALWKFVKFIISEYDITIIIFIIIILIINFWL